MRGHAARHLGTLGLAAVIYGAFLPSLGFFDPEEGRHVSIAVAMLRTHDFLIPQLQGFPYLEKPPLTYWMTAASFRLFGKNEMAGRLPVALMGFLGTLAISWLARRALGPAAAWLTAGVSVLTTAWFVQARYLTTDMILAGSMAIALCGFALGVSTGRRGWYWLFWFGLALATLAKGFVGVLLPAAIVFLFVVATRRVRVLMQMHPLAGLGLWIVLVVPWFFLVHVRFPDFLRYYVLDQHVARFVSEHAEHAKSFWFFLPVVAVGFFPWLVHLPLERSRHVPADGFPIRVFLWTWFGVIFLFFSASSGKLMPYILPAYPPLAVLVAMRLAPLWETSARDAVRSTCRRSVVVAGLLVVSAPLVWLGVRRYLAADPRVTFDEIALWALALVGVCAVGGLVVLALALRGRARGAVAAQAGFQIALFLVLLGAVRATDPYVSPRVLGDVLARVVRPEDRVLLYRLQQPSLEFYLDRPPTLVEWSGEYAYGMKLRPDPELVLPDIRAVRELLASDRTVYVVTKREEPGVPDIFEVPMELVGGNRKRAIYRNHPSS